MLAQYVALAGTWGASFLFIKVGFEGLSPGQVVLGRLASGALALALVCAVTRQRLPRDPALWGLLAVVAVRLCVAPFLLFAWAERHVSSGLASILNATTPPMTTLVILVALRQERPTRTRLGGLLTGFAGVVLVLAPWTTTTSGVLAAVLALVILGAGVASLLNTDVVTGWGATNTSTVTYLTPWSGSPPALLSSASTSPGTSLSEPSASPPPKTASPPRPGPCADPHARPPARRPTR